MTTSQPTSESTRTYPSAPWTLRGKAIQSLQPLDVDQVRPLLPPELDLVQVWPGKTLGGVYIAAYGGGSVLDYHELIVFTGIARHGDRTGAWVSHIYVDNPASVAGGRNIWGLPKQEARFHWAEGDQPQVSVYQEEQLLCRLSYGWQVPGLRQSLPWLGSFSTQGSDLVWFAAKSDAYPHLLLGADLQIPDRSPFASLGLHHPWLVFYLRDLSLRVEAPTVEGMTAGRPMISSI